MLQRKVDGLEEVVREKDTHMQEMRQTMQNLPAMQQQRNLQVRKKCTKIK